jgi:hypothetical protein
MFISKRMTIAVVLFSGLLQQSVFAAEEKPAFQVELVGDLKKDDQGFFRCEILASLTPADKKEAINYRTGITISAAPIFTAFKAGTKKESAQRAPQLPVSAKLTSPSNNQFISLSDENFRPLSQVSNLVYGKVDIASAINLFGELITEKPLALELKYADSKDDALLFFTPPPMKRADWVQVRDCYYKVVERITGSVKKD